MRTRRDIQLSPYPGVKRTELLGVLRSVHIGLINIRSVAGTLRSELPMAYLAWVDESVRQLRYLLPVADQQLLLLTRRYWAIQAAPRVESANITDTEIDDRNTAILNAIEWVEQLTKKWEYVAGRLVVADTSVFCRYPDKIADIDFPGLLGRGPVPVRLMIPVLVLDELDSLKQSKDSHTRWRAAHTLGKLDEVLDSGADGVGLLRGPEELPNLPPGPQAQPVSVQLHFDPPGHRRLPINDDELIDRAIAIQAEAERDVTFLTYDTGQSTRAKFAGLAVKKLKEDPGPEPTPRK